MLYSESSATCEVGTALSHLKTWKDHLHPGSVDVGKGEVVLSFEDRYEFVQKIVLLEISLSDGTSAVEHR